MTEYIIVSTSEGYPISCPECGHAFGIKQRKGGGTYYASKIKQLTKVSLLIIRWWLKANPDSWLTTRDAYRLFHTHAYEHSELYKQDDYLAMVGCKMASFVARMSEMTGLKIFTSTAGERRTDKDTQVVKNVVVSMYKINKERAWQIVEADGKIDAEAEREDAASKGAGQLGEGRVNSDPLISRLPSETSAATVT